MKRRIAAIAILAVLLLCGVVWARMTTVVVGRGTSAWTWTADFESGTLGQVASGTSGFDYAASLTTYSNEQTHGGTKACKMHWTSGSDGYEGCAGWWGYDDGNHNITNGQELWVRGYYYFKSPWDWTCDPVVKILRAPVRTSSNGHNGYISVFTFQNGEYGAESPGAMGYSNETTNGEGQTAAVPNALFSTDQWICLEMYIKFSPTAGIQRIWRNGILVQERTNSTFDATSNISPGGGWVMSYWNGGAPQAQDMYLDDFQATTDTPSNRDAAGNPMIGPIDWSSSDTTAPTVSITTSSPQTITSDSLTVIGTASDAVWGTGSVCKWRLGSAPDANNGTTISGLTYSGTVDWSFTASGFSIGSNTLYIGCRDAVPNWGSKSMAVNYNLSSQGVSGVSALTVR